MSDMEDSVVEERDSPIITRKKAEPQPPKKMDEEPMPKNKQVQFESVPQAPAPEESSKVSTQVDEKAMSQFPDDFHRKPCERELERNQLELLRKTRYDFYQTYVRARGECERSIKFMFPKKLWHSHRKTITIEILERFGEIKVTNCSENETIRTIADREKIPDMIKAVTIEFVDL
jgi:hypothetical protein